MSLLRNTTLLLGFALVLSGCPSLPSPPPPPVQRHLPPIPADVMVPREPNFLTRLLNFLQDSPAKPTLSSSN